jgi:hypothetical protein
LDEVVGSRRTRKQVDGSKEKWKPDMTAIKAVIQLVKAIERLQGQVAPRVEDEDEERWGHGAGLRGKQQCLNLYARPVATVEF